MATKKYFYKEKIYSDPFEEFKDDFTSKFYVDEYRTSEECYKSPGVPFDYNQIEDSDRKKYYTDQLSKNQINGNKGINAIQKYIKKYGPLTNEPFYRNLKKNEILKKINLLSQKKEFLNQKIPNTQSLDLLIRDLFQKRVEMGSIKKEIEALRINENSYFINKGWIFSSKDMKKEVADKINDLGQTYQLLSHKVNSTEFDDIKKIIGELRFIDSLIAEYSKRINRFLREEKSEAKKKERDEKKLILEQKKLDAGLLREQKRKEKEEKKQAELNTYKNKVQQKEKEKRKTLKKMKPTLKHLGYCPYCFESFSADSVTHVDHIYPLSKGGLESAKNLVVVCSTCNLNKGKLTLNSFIKKFNLNRDAIEKELDLLGKEY